MHRQLVLATITCLLAVGCAKDSAIVAGDPFIISSQETSPDEAARTVFIWDGKKCVEAIKTDEQLLGMKLSRYTMANFMNVERHQNEVWARPSVMEGLLAEGGSIPLPNGETMTFPGKNAVGPAVASNGRLTFSSGHSIPIAPSVPDGTEFRMETYDTAQLLDPQTFAAEKAEFHRSQLSAAAKSNDELKIPPSGSVQGRVGTASVSYGMGQISRP